MSKFKLLKEYIGKLIVAQMYANGGAISIILHEETGFDMDMTKDHGKLKIIDVSDDLLKVVSKAGVTQYLSLEHIYEIIVPKTLD